jgi:hypothetical protein
LLARHLHGFTYNVPPYLTLKGTTHRQYQQGTTGIEE